MVNSGVSFSYLISFFKDTLLRFFWLVIVSRFNVSIFLARSSYKCCDVFYLSLFFGNVGNRSMNAMGAAALRWP